MSVLTRKSGGTCCQYIYCSYRKTVVPPNVLSWSWEDHLHAPGTMCSLWPSKQKHGLCSKSYQILNWCFHLLLKISPKFHSLKKNENVACLLWEHRSSEKANSFQIKDGILCIRENRNVKAVLSHGTPPWLGANAASSWERWQVTSSWRASVFQLHRGKRIFWYHSED